MAASTPLVSSLLSHKKRQAASRKERRKRRRQAIAKAKDSGLTNETSLEEEEGDGNVTPEEESRRLHEEWLERERQAQEAFRLMFEREEAIRKRKEDEERLIKEEWEAQQKKEQEEKEQKLQEKRDREKVSFLNRETQKKKQSLQAAATQNKDEAVQKMLDEAESQLENGAPWMNPEAPGKEKGDNYGTEQDVANCPFFLKTGACRFGDRCSRKHVYPASSRTLMIRGMFVTFGMEEVRRDDYDGDACLEHSEEDLLESFTDFYKDVLPEFRSVGKVVQFKVSCNHEPHLRGNVYVQFETEEQCKQAFIKFNGRWYACRQLHCEFCPVTRWKNAICGLFDRRKCPKGKNCNFLHVFRNPGNEFWEADRDMNTSPDRSVRGSRREGWNSERNSERSWRSRQGSRSPPRSERSDRWSSTSRERWSSQQHRSERWSVRSGTRGRERSRSRDRKRNGSRERSRSRDRKRNGSRERSRSREGERHSRKRSRSRERERRRNGSRDKSADADVNKSVRSRSQSRDGGRSPRQDVKEKALRDKSNGRRHKHSKKSKKKSKKKHKKKDRLSEKEDGSSSGESDKELETEVSNNDRDTKTEVSNNEQETKTEVSNNDRETKTEVSNNDRETKTEVSNNDRETKTELSNNDRETKTEVSNNDRETKTEVSNNDRETKPTEFLSPKPDC